MLDWFYNYLGSNASPTIYLIILLFLIPTLEASEDKSKSLHGKTRLLATIGIFILGSMGIFVCVMEKSFKYDYVARQFGVEFLQNATDKEIDKRMDELRDEKHGSKQDADRELYKSLFDWANDVNVNVPIDVKDIGKEAELYKLEVDSSFGKHRKHE